MPPPAPVKARIMPTNKPDPRMITIPSARLSLRAAGLRWAQPGVSRASDSLSCYVFGSGPGTALQDFKNADAEQHGQCEDQRFAAPCSE